MKSSIDGRVEIDTSSLHYHHSTQTLKNPAQIENFYHSSQSTPGGQITNLSTEGVRHH